MLLLPLAPEKHQVRHAILPRLEDLVLDVVAVAAADAHARDAAVVAAEPGVGVVRALIADVRKVVAVVGAAAGVHNDGVALVTKGALERVVIGAGRRVAVAVLEKVRRKVKVVEVPGYGRRRLLDVAGGLVVVEAAEAYAQQRRQARKGDGLHRTRVAAALVAGEVVEGVVGNVLVQGLLQSLPGASQRDGCGNPFKRRKCISLGVAIQAFDGG